MRPAAHDPGEAPAAPDEGGIPPVEPLTNLFLHRSEVSGDRPASFAKTDGRWSAVTWRETRLAVEEVMLGLVELGARRGDAIGIISNTRREWSQIDIAVLCFGGITVGVYPTLTGAQTRFQLEHSRVRFVFVEDRTQRVKVEESAGDLGLKVISLETKPEGTEVLTFDALRRLGAKRRIDAPDEFARRAREAKSSDVVTYVYTSGTTGEAKGAMLTHANFHYVIHATSRLIPYDGERTLAFLPLAHSLQRYVNYLGLIADAEAYYAESIEKVPDNLLEVRPTALTLVPRVLEKIYARAMAAGGEGGRVRQRLFASSLSSLKRRGAADRGGLEPGLRLRLRARLADELVGKRVRARFGGRVKFIGCGSAPIAREVHEFFEDLGLPILEGWGLTETSAPVTINTLTNRRIGSVGRPLPGTYVKLAEDGEILVKGPGVFIGYYENASATRDAFDGEGWFKTGDIGVMSRDGFLRITDRKKDLIITAGGKNVAPQPIEGQLKRDPLISQAVVLGDRRPYLSALLALDPEVQQRLSEEHRVDPADAAALAEVPAVRARIDALVAEVNANLARFEQIKRWSLFPRELTVESGELTPTLKVKRNLIRERYTPQIERLYTGEG
ncbi:MAG: long-chain fatty acid--CoA ligase [Deltaproteobacteria bacterium]|nr:long-chain fatty acid--CoA ligase [Deltaproteobacteria bacterium]